MLLNTKVRYAVTAMADLASLKEDKPVALSAIAERQDIPLAYLEQIMAMLKKAELIISVRGPGGGYKLSRPASEILISEITAAVDESVEMTRCSKSGEGKCSVHSARCTTHDLWEGLTRQIEVYLAAISLEDVVMRRVRQKTPSKVASKLQSMIQTEVRP